MGWIEWFVVKNSETTSWHELLHHFGPFCTEFCRQPNGSKYIQIVRNTQKHEFRVQWGGSVAFVAKNSDATLWHEFLHKFGPFWTECCNTTNCPKCTQIVRNTPKYEVRVQKGVSGLFVAKNSDMTSWHELLHHFGPFCTEFCKATKRSQMHPNSTKYTKTWF